MPSQRSNRSELDDLTTAQRTAVNEGANALDHLTGRASFNAWMQVALGIVPLCALADRPGRSRSARRSLFKEAGYGSLSPANISRLLHMGRLESHIRIWRTGLKPRQRDTWNSPATICKRCPEVRKAIEEANKNRPPRVPRPRPVVDPADELELTVNRLYDLLDAVKDIDLRREQIERLTTLLSELSGREEPKPATKARKAKPTEEEMEAEPAKAKPPSRKASRAQAEQTVKAVKPQPEQANDGPLLWQQSITDPALRSGPAEAYWEAADPGADGYRYVVEPHSKRDNRITTFSAKRQPPQPSFETPIEFLGKARSLEAAMAIAARHNDAAKE